MVLQRYRATKELGKGSFGTVYLTEGRRDKRHYVVKVHSLLLNLMGKHMDGSHFNFTGSVLLLTCMAQVVDNLRENNLKVQEIRVMMHLKHRNIVEMCDFYTSELSFTRSVHACCNQRYLFLRVRVAGNNQLCIVMEFADGGDLRKEIVSCPTSRLVSIAKLMSCFVNLS